MSNVFIELVGLSLREPIVGEHGEASADHPGFVATVLLLLLAVALLFLLELLLKALVISEKFRSRRRIRC